MNVWDVKSRLARKRLLSSEEVVDFCTSGRSLGVILDSDEEPVKKAFLSLQQRMQVSDENTFFLLCGKKAVENDIFEAVSFLAEDFGWNGSLKNEKAEAFLRRRYDLLISFAASENKLSAFAVSVARADLKVGRESSQKCDFDLLISTADPQLFTTELEKYLKILNTAV